jgi:hypothetical protein
LWQVPIQVMGDGWVPGGHEFDEPPQHEQRNPSMAQYFQ